MYPKVPFPHSCQEYLLKDNHTERDQHAGRPRGITRAQRYEPRSNHREGRARPSHSAPGTAKAEATRSVSAQEGSLREESFLHQELQQSEELNTADRQLRCSRVAVSANTLPASTELAGRGHILAAAPDVHSTSVCVSWFGSQNLYTCPSCRQA